MPASECALQIRHKHQRFFCPWRIFSNFEQSPKSRLASLYYSFPYWSSSLGLVGYFYDNLAAPVRRAREHFMSLASLVEPQHFAHFAF